MLYGIGGTPEGVISAAALKCVGGGIQGRLWPRDDEERQRLLDAGLDPAKVLYTNDLVAGEDVFVAATGVTTGALLAGVQYTPGGAVTDSIVMRSRSGTVRRIMAQHALEKLSELTGFEVSLRNPWFLRGPPPSARVARSSRTLRESAVSRSAGSRRRHARTAPGGLAAPARVESCRRHDCPGSFAVANAAAPALATGLSAFRLDRDRLLLHRRRVRARCARRCSSSRGGSTPAGRPRRSPACRPTP